jgi:hypothetical protein
MAVRRFASANHASDQQPPVRARASSRPAQRLLVNAPLA